MDSTSFILMGALLVIVALYILRRRSRLKNHV